jgi:hypothetical protein
MIVVVRGDEELAGRAADLAGRLPGVVGSRQKRVAGSLGPAPVCLRSIRSPGVQTALGSNHRRDTPATPIANGVSPVRAPKSSRLGVMVFEALPVPSVGSAPKNESWNPRSVTRWGRIHRAGGIKPVEAPHRPRSQNLQPKPLAS